MIEATELTSKQAREARERGRANVLLGIQQALEKMEREAVSAGESLDPNDADATEFWKGFDQGVRYELKRIRRRREHAPI